MNEKTLVAILDKFFVRRDGYGTYQDAPKGNKAGGLCRKEEVTTGVIAKHIRGDGQPIGTYAHSPEGKSRWICLDYDASKEAKKLYLKGNGEKLISEKRELWAKVCETCKRLKAASIPFLLEDSVGGFHVWIFFESEVDLNLAFDFAHTLDTTSEVFPKGTDAEKWGNFVRLPGRYHSNEAWCKILSGKKWLSVQEPETWEVILKVPGVNVEKVAEWIRDHGTPRGSATRSRVTGSPEPEKSQSPESNQTYQEACAPYGKNSVAFRNAVLATLKECSGICNDFDTWKKLALALKSAGYEYEEVDPIFAQSLNYDHDENIYLYNRMNPTEITFGTAYDYALKANPNLLKENLALIPIPCNRCGAGIIFIDRKPFNPDKTPHRCPRKKKQEVPVPPEEIPLEDHDTENVKDYLEYLKGLEKSEIEKLFATCTIQELKKEIETLPDKTLLLFKAPTGIGKTFTLLQAMIRIAEGATFLGATITEAERSYSIVKGIDEKLSIGLVVSSRNGGEEEGEEEHCSYGKYNISTYGYLGSRGETTDIYPEKCRELFEGKVVFCDEIQSLWQKITVQYAMASRYRKTGGDDPFFQQLGKCPLSAKSGNCANCYFYAWRTGTYGWEGKREFYANLPDLNGKKPDIGIGEWEKLLDPSSYHQVVGTFFMGHFLKVPPLNCKAVSDWIQERIVREDGKKKEDKKETYADYLRFLAESLSDAHLRIEMPIREHKTMITVVNPDFLAKKDEEERKKLEKQIKIPIGKCFIPYLCGYDRLPLIELMSLARKLVFCTATLPAEMLSLIQDIAKELGWQVRFREIKEIPFQFDVTVLKTTTKIEDGKLKKALKELDQEDHKTFIIQAYKYKAERLYSICAGRINGVVEFFRERDFYGHLEYRHRYETEGIKHIITYARAAICKGVDLPDVTICIVDCTHFLPRASFANITPLDTAEEIRGKMLRELEFNLIQILGRIFRSRETRIPGQTVQDKRKIVILLHGIPEGMEDFKLDQELFYHYEEIRETFLSGKPDELVDDITEAIKKSLAREALRNRKEEANEELMEKGKKEGQMSLSKKQREELKDKLKEEREKTKLITLEEKVISMAKDGVAWRDASHKLHLDRLDQETLERLKQKFNKG